ncbi:MAG: Asp-tRNA(Asn)/Glu-tRNA(Gln) amidotransferase subunit GatC [Lactobacillales bacterium]|jgi:aspartyl-tRNA(Asn)/glutamyl-tRNA(Gln) amidotransferase subunit C|nr:Asp-tRNA(Asn)/Glu-tRNA(Gln) amidotransferase subunit GatC [Lactobacillales bacterium]
MSFDTKTIQNIAKLARLKLTPEAQEKFTTEVDGILKWVEQLNAVDVTGIDPLVSVFTQENDWRKDAVTIGNIQKELMQNAPEEAHGFYVVPKVVE